MITEKMKNELLCEHLMYEIEMLNFSYHLWCNSQGRQSVINLCIDNMLLHSRNLMEFFYYSRNKKQQYARAVDYINNFANKIPAKYNKIKKDIQRRANPEVMHLGYKRISGTPPEKAWDIVSNYEAWKEIFEIFIFNLSDKYKKILQPKNDENE